MKLVQIIFLSLLFLSCHQNANSSSAQNQESTEKQKQVEQLNNAESDSLQPANEVEITKVDRKDYENKPAKKKEASIVIIKHPESASKELFEEGNTSEILDVIEPILEPQVEEEIISDKKLEINSLAPDHSIWDKLLSALVDNKGNVDYSQFKKRESELDNYLSSLKRNPVEKSWDRAEKMAYWINAYNAFTIKLILNNYPTSSIMNIDGGKAWDKKWIKLGNETYSLNQIENDILRPVYKDARIHFAVNCAAKSCPPLSNKALTSKNLEQSLETLTKSFINNAEYNEIAIEKIRVSNIFNWYASDFGELIDFLNKYSNTQISAKANLSYTDYDWSLNGK